MSDSKNRLYRAVRLLPEAVRIGSVTGADSSLTDGAEGTQTSKALARELQLQARIESLEREAAALRERNEALEAARKKAEVALVSGLAEREGAYEAERDAVLATAQAEGFEKGRRAGHEEGSKKAEAELEATYRGRFDEALTLLEAIHRHLEASFSELEQALEPRLVRLWNLTLSRLLAREVALDEDPLIPLLREVLLRTSDRERVIVYLHPQDLEHVGRAREVLGDILRGTEHLDFRGDDHVDRGSCLVETNLGVYDARFRTQLAGLAREIDSVLFGGGRERHGTAEPRGGDGDGA